MLPRWPEETLYLRHPKSLPEGFQHTTRVLARNRVYTGIGQCGIASSEWEQMTTKQRGSVRLNEGAKSAKPEPMDHHQKLSSFSELTCSIDNRHWPTVFILISAPSTFFCWTGGKFHQYCQTREISYFLPKFCLRNVILGFLNCSASGAFIRINTVINHQRTHQYRWARTLHYQNKKLKRSYLYIVMSDEWMTQHHCPIQPPPILVGVRSIEHLIYWEIHKSGRSEIKGRR